MADPIDSALTPGETILWRGRPGPSARGPSPEALRLLGAAGALASGSCAALTVYALVAALRHGDHFESPLLFMLALVTLAMFAACVRFVFRPARLNFGDDDRMHYAVTSRRVIVALDTNPPSIRALPIDGSLVVDETISDGGRGALVFRNGGDEDIMFDSIGDAASVLKIIHTARDATR